MKLPTCVKLLS
jgi:hypothetical protein